MCRFPFTKLLEQNSISMKICILEMQDGEDSITLSKPRSVETIKANSRSFKANPTYVRFFNHQINDFFNNIYPKGYPSKDYFTTSKLSPEGKITYTTDESYELESGTVWTSKEKDSFFNALARYSIHQINMIQAHLPGKSVMEIMEFYNKLKLDLKELKKLCFTIPRKFKIRLSKKKGDTFSYSENCIRNGHALVSYLSIPAAYEMTEDFIQVEEAQSALISQWERHKINDENQRFKKSFEEYIGIKRRKLNPPNGECLQLYEEDAFSKTSLVNKQELIDVDTCTDMTKSIYAKNRITVLENSRLAPKLHFKSLIFLEQLVTLTTEMILSKLVELKTEAIWLNKRNVELSSEGLTLHISKRDIENAVEDCGLFRRERSNLGHEPTTPITLSGYFSRIWERLGAHELLSRSTQRNVETESSVYGKFEGFESTDRARHLIRAHALEDAFISRPIAEVDLETGVHMKPNDIVHISSLLSLRSTTPEINRFNEDYESELIEEILTLQEAKSLEEEDIEYSRMHEHGLLTYLTTFGVTSKLGTSEPSISTNYSELSGECPYNGSLPQQNEPILRTEDQSQPESINVNLPKELLKAFSHKFSDYE